MSPELRWFNDSIPEDEKNLINSITGTKWAFDSVITSNPNYRHNVYLNILEIGIDAWENYYYDGTTAIFPDSNMSDAKLWGNYPAPHVPGSLLERSWGLVAICTHKDTGTTRLYYDACGNEYFSADGHQPTGKRLKGIHILSCYGPKRVMEVLPKVGSLYYPLPTMGQGYVKQATQIDIDKENETGFTAPNLHRRIDTEFLDNSQQVEGHITGYVGLYGTNSFVTVNKHDKREDDTP